jgi:N-acetylglucosaminyldiphosphoundecaprenol N-acetyl-beta-D-mannosaminyltransferase
MVAIDRFKVAGVPINLLNMQMACEEVERRYRTREGGYCIFRDMNGIVGANDDPGLLRAHQDAALVMPDGMPLVWLARLKGFDWVGRVYGPDFMLEFCRISEHIGLRHYLFGSTEAVVEKLAEELLRAFPDLEICGRYSPPIRELSYSANLDDVERIRAARADVVWVGLGTPKQEFWMQANAPLLRGCLLMGVGAAFDFHAKLKRQAPRWMQRAGLEWSFRLMTEPRRLARRYLIGIPRFLFLLARHGCESPHPSRNSAS